MSAVVFYYCRSELTTDSKFTIRSVFSTGGSFGQQNPEISRQKSLISLVLRDIPNFLAPTPSRGRPPPHPKISGPKSLGLGSFFLPQLSSSLNASTAKSGCLGRGEASGCPPAVCPQNTAASICTFLTVGFLYGAGAETLIFVTGTSGKYPKIFLPRQKNQSQL